MLLSAIKHKIDEHTSTVLCLTWGATPLAGIGDMSDVHLTHQSLNAGNASVQFLVISGMTRHL